MLTDRFYYNRLSNKEKTIYNELYKSIINLQPVAKVTGCLTMPTVKNIIEAITNDNPHLYFFNQTEVRLQMSALSSTVYLTYFFNKSEIALYNKKIEEAVNKIIKKLQLETAESEYEIEKRVHDTLASHLEYDHSAISTTDKRHLAIAHSIVGVFVDKKAVCEGIAKATKILLNTANIHCIVVTGNSTLEKHEGHAWNIVKINNAAYHLDITWDIANSTKKYVNYDYFNLNDMEISKDHSNFKDVPLCISTEANYYNFENLLFSDISAAKKHIKKLMKENKHYINIKWQSTTIDLNETAKALVQFSLSLAATDGYRWQAKYTVNPEQNTIKIFLNVAV